MKTLQPSQQPSWGHLSTERAGMRERRYARWTVLVSALVFLAALPYATRPVAQVPAFIPIYVSTLVLCDLITAVLLFSQFSALRSLELLVLAGGYLFTASITSAYALTFPGLFAETGLLGAGPQTSSAFYMFWHGAFPAIVIAYALIKGRSLQGARPGGPAWRAVVATVVLVLAVVAGFTAFATQGQASLPIFLQGHKTTELGHAMLLGIWLMSLLSLGALWRRWPHSVLDVWLMVVSCAWLFDLALSALLNTGRYDLGWYAGRIYGLLAAAFLLIVLLSENTRHFARLVRLSGELRDANEQLQRLSLEDSLTGLANRRAFDKYLTDQRAAATRHKRPLALVLVDVDHFKSYNDHYGHQAGDERLKQVAATLQSCCLRATDMAARYGGEEFALVLPDTDLAGARRVAEAVRASVAGLRMAHRQCSTGEHVSVSSGIAVLDAAKPMNPAQLIVAADAALYQAKALGRNRVESLAAAA